MSRVILVNCGANIKAPRTPLEHLGLGYLAALLEGHGIPTRIIDASFHDFSRADMVQAVLQDRPPLVGFTIYYNNIAETLNAIAELRQQGYDGHITLGGHHATFNASEILTNCREVSSIVMGEGEGAITDLAFCLESSQDWQGLANLAYLGDGQVTVNPCRPLLEDLDMLPFPWRQDYGEHLRQHKVAAMVSSRGCYGRCTFCSIRAFYGMSRGQPWRSRSPENVVEEMVRLQREYGIQRITFMDDEFLGMGRLGHERSLAIGEEILRRGLRVSFSIVCRPDNLSTKALSVLKAAGLDCVDIGIESWIPRQLALYGKQVSLAQNLAAVNTLKKLDLTYRLYVIPIDPYLTVDELLENLDRLEQESLEHFHEGSFLARLVVFKGTEIAKRLQADGLLRSPENGSYLGFLDYDFQDPRMRLLHPLIHQIAGDFNKLQEKLRRIFYSKALNSEEIDFGVKLKIALSHTFLTQLRLLLNSHEPEMDFPAIMANINEVHTSIYNIEQAWKNGVFNRFQPCGFLIGQELIEFPQPGFRALHKSLMSSLLEPGA